MKNLLVSLALLFTTSLAQAQDLKKDIAGIWNVTQISFNDKHGRKADELLNYEKGERAYTFKKSKVTFVWSQKHAGEMKETLPYSIVNGALNMGESKNIRANLSIDKKSLFFKEVNDEDGSVTITIFER